MANKEEHNMENKRIKKVVSPLYPLLDQKLPMLVLEDHCPEARDQKGNKRERPLEFGE